MSINIGNVSVTMPLLLLLLLLISIVAGGSVPSGYGQNSPPPNITTSDIVDLFGNVTDENVIEGEGGIGGEETPPEEGEETPPEEGEETPPEEGEAAEGEDSSSSSLPLVNDDDEEQDNSMSSSSSVTTNDAATIMINEVELNPAGSDEGKQWIELYNPTDGDINIGNFEIRTSSESATIKLPPDAIIEAGETYVIEFEEQILNIVEILTLADATGNILDRTPSLVDMSNDERTWQRIPDGNNEWRFVENTKGKLNEPNATRNGNMTHSSYSGNSEAHCLGSAGCLEGLAIRIVDAGTLYVKVNSTIYKIDLALLKAPSSTEEGFIESTAFTRDLCLGDDVLIDQDDNLLTSTGSSIIAVVYCSGINLNSELLYNGYADLDAKQCGTSKFASQPWAKDHGC